MATFIVVFVGWLTNSGVMICVSWLSSAVEFKSLVNSEGDHDEESPPLSEARNEGVAALRGGADLDGVGVTAEARWDHGFAALRGPGAEVLLGAAACVTAMVNRGTSREEWSGVSGAVITGTASTCGSGIDPRRGRA
jgi:hypothetical protein